MKRSIGVVAGTVAAAVLLAACNNNNSNNPVVPTPGPNCNGPANSMQVLYPKPGTGSAPPTTQIIYVATNAALVSGNQYDFVASQSNGSTQYTINSGGAPVSASGSGFQSVSASQIPSPHANPSFPNPVYYATILQYPAGPLQTVNLYWNDYGTQCNPNVLVASFTTK